jgi:hypothetical protein
MTSSVVFSWALPMYILHFKAYLHDSPEPFAQVAPTLVFSV